MTKWLDVAADAPEFAARVRAVFDSGTNKTMATLRLDGSPRISATELKFENEVTLGMMPDSLKLRDVLRDGRVAIHSPTLEPPTDNSGWQGDAKLAGVLVRIPPPADNQIEGAAFFALDISEVAWTYLGEPADHLVIESWHPGRGWQRVTRN
jgi:hypothetical protein